MITGTCKYCGKPIDGQHLCAEFWQHPDNQPPPAPKSQTASVPGRMSFTVLELKD